MHKIAPQQPEINPATRRPELDDVAELPPGLDPVRHRIIAEHFFGFRPVGAIAAEIIQDLAFRRKVQRLHAKGPRLVAELLSEIGAERSLTSLIEAKIEKYVDIDDALALDAIGGRDFPPDPLHEVDDVGAAGEADDG